MFCWNCGNQIPDKSKFCMNCGATISHSSEDPHLNCNTGLFEQESQSAQAQASSIKFEIQDTTIKFPEQIQEYTKRRKDFANQMEPFIRQQAKRAEKDISELTSENIDRCIDIFGTFGSEISDQLIDVVHQSLLQERIYTTSRETIAEMFDNSAQYFVAECNLFLEKYLEIISDAKQLEEYKALKRSGRIYWRGGGFGIKGALVGAAKAGAMNFFTGAIYKGIDAAGNAIDRNRLYKNKVALLQSKNWIRIFKEALKKDMYQMFEVYASILSSHNKLAIPKLDMSLSQTYFKSGNNVTPQAEKIHLFLEALQYNPYNIHIYIALGKLIGVTNEKLLKMYDYFMAFHEIHAYISLVFFYAYTSKIKAIAGNSFNELDKKIALAEQQLSSVKDLKCISSSFDNACKPYEQFLQNDYNQYLEKRLTSDDGHHFDTVEDINLYLKEREEYKKYRQETLDRIVPLERQDELLAQAEASQFQNQIILQNIAQWKKELADCHKAQDAYPKSFEHYFFFSCKGPDPKRVVARFPLNVQKYLLNVPYIAITQFTSIQTVEIHPSSLSFSRIEAWFFTSNFYVGVIIPDRSETHIMPSRDLTRVQFQEDQNTFIFYKSDMTCEKVKIFIFHENVSELNIWINAVNNMLKFARNRISKNLCPICGKPLFEGAAFCGGCGCKL